MTMISVPDDGGDEMSLFSYNGYNYPAFPSEAIRHMSSVKIRSDDIIIIAYPKSGTNWVYEIIRLLLAEKVDKEDTSKMAGMIEFLEEDAYKDLSSPRILNTHVLYRHLPEEAKVRKPRIVYITRNPKDVLVSFYNFVKDIPFFKYSGEWKNYLKPAIEGKFAYGSWCDYMKDWEEVKKTIDVPILTLQYEDQKEDPCRETKKLRDFLALDRSDGFVKEVCETSNFASMRKIKQRSKLVYRKGEVGVIPLHVFITGAIGGEGYAQLSRAPAIISEVGDWKNWFTVAQNEWFDQLYQEKMKDDPLEFRYSLH